MPPIAHFTIPGEIASKGRPRMTRAGHAFTPTKTRNFESYVRLCAAQAMAGRPPVDEAVAVTIEVHVLAPMSWSNKKRAQALAGTIHPAGRPDLDNQVKAITDAMNTVVITDDARIVMITARKLYSSTPGALVMVEAI